MKRRGRYTWLNFTFLRLYCMLLTQWSGNVFPLLLDWNFKGEISKIWTLLSIKWLIIARKNRKVTCLLKQVNFTSIRKNMTKLWAVLMIWKTICRVNGKFIWNMSVCWLETINSNRLNRFCLKELKITD